MSTVKISELAGINLNSNTSNTIFVGVDLPTLTTGKISATSLAQRLYLNNSLVVGNNNILFPNTVGQFSGNSQTYFQVNLQNFTGNGSSDFVATADNGIDANGFINMGVNGSTFSDPNYSAMLPNDGYLYVHGPFDNQPIGNLVIGTATSNAIINFIVGGTTSQNIVGYISRTGIHSSSIDNAISSNIAVVQGVNLTQNTNITTANNAAWAAFNKANNALANTSGTFGGDLNVAGTMNVNNILTVITSPPASSPSITVVSTQNQNLLLQAVSNTWTFVANGTLLFPDNTIQRTAFTGSAIDQPARNTANNALANTTNIFTAGDFNVSRKLTTNGTVVFANSNFSATEAAVTISASGVPPATPANDGYMIHISGKNGVPARIITDSYGTGAYSVYASRTARGTLGSPAPVQANDIIGRFSANGYGNTKFQTFGTGRIDFVAAENYTDANTGSRIQFWNCTIGSNTLTNIATFNGNSVIFTGAVEPQKGFVYTPRLPVGNQTAITIDYRTDSMIKANLVADLTISHSNFVTGKVVEVWLTNTGGTQRTVTHGCSALNSTINSTTFTIPATSSAYLKYFSIDGDIANTFVTVQHA